MVALVGMCRRTGRLIGGVEHRVQSIADILSTRKGTGRPESVQQHASRSPFHCLRQ